MSPKFMLFAALLASSPACADTVVASWYGPYFHGRRTAAGCVYDQHAMTAASRTLPFGTLIEVSRGDRVVEVVINDRGPYVRGRGLDLSRAAAEALGMRQVGVARVQVEVVGVMPPCRRLARSATVRRD